MPANDAPATPTEIATALGALFRAMPAPRGVKVDERLPGYLSALRGLSLQAVESAIAKFLRGEVPGLSLKYCPLPPELAQVARQITVGEAAAVAKATQAEKPPPRPLKKTAFLTLWDEAGGTLAGWSRLMAGRPDYGQPLKKPKPAQPAPPAKRQVPDYSKDKIEISPVLAAQLEERKRAQQLAAEIEGTEFDMNPQPKPRGKRK